MYSRFLKLLFIVLTAFPLFLSGQQYISQKYDLESGLPSTSVYDINQGVDGRMWFATRNGITSYDGINWKTYEPDWTVLSKDFTHIVVDSQGTVWISTQILEDGLFYLANDSLHRIKGPQHHPLQKNTYEYITAVSTVYSEQKLYVVVGTLSSGLYIWDSEKWVNYSPLNSPLGGRIKTVKSDGRNLYILSNRGLILYSDGKFSSRLQETYNLKANQIYDISLEWSYNSFYKKQAIKRIWLVAADWLGYIERNTLYTFKHRLLNYRSYPEFDRLKSLPDGHGGLLFANEETLFHLNSQGKIKTIKSNNGLAGEGASALFMDMEENIWIANTRGITKIPTFRLRNYTADEGLLENEVTALRPWQKDVLVIGHITGLTFKKKNGFEYIVFYPKDKYLMISRVMSIAIDKYNRLWVADLYNGIARITTEKKVKWFRIKDVQTHAIFTKSDKEIWVGTSKGLFKFEGENFRQVKDKTIPEDLVRNIIQARDGSILVATSRHGLFVYRNDRWENYRNEGNREFNNAYCGYVDQGGKILVGTKIGLCTVSGDSLIKYNQNFALDRPVYFIKKDKNNRLWLGTNNGVYIWNGYKLTHLNKTNGLAGNELNRAAFYEDEEGLIWLGTEGGLSIYDSKYDHSDEVQPRLWLTSVQIDGKQIDPGKPIQLEHSENNLTFHFRFTSFRDEKKVSLRYKLEGFDNVWRKNSKIISTSIHYFNLPPGKYRFLIQLESVDRVWSQVVSSKTIQILLPFWKNWWFYLLIVIMLIFILYYVVYYNSRIQYAKRLEKQIELRTRQLRLSEMKYRSIFENSQDAVILSTPEGNVIDANPAAQKMFGYDSKAEFLKISITKDIYLQENDRNKFLNEIKETGYVKDLELRLKRKDGAPLVALLSSNLYKDTENSGEQYLTVLKDVTQRWQLKEQLAQAQRMESVGMLAGGIAHDFNNILGGILGYASLMKLQMSEDDRFYKFVDSIEKSAVRGAELTNQLLVFAKRGQAQLSRVNINDIVKDTLKIICSTFPKSIQTKTNLSERVPPILSDEAQLHQVLMNLCVNARDAINEKGTITINTKSLTIDKELAKQYSVSQEGTFVVIEVSDTGVGIEPNLLNRIFEPFFSTKEQGKGTGLGLSMIFGFVHSQNGFIDVESTPGKGSIFRIFLPAIPADEGEQKLKRPGRQLQKGDEVILVVDDEKVLRDFLKQALEGYGYTVLEAEDGENAVEIFKENSEKVKLIILDMIMPNMSGEKALFQIRQMNSSVPVLVSSGYSDKDKFERMAELGIAGILHKPFRINKLLTQIRTILDN